MKKVLLVLAVVLVVFSSCRKDLATDANITNGDLININGQLKGSWVYPVKTLTIVDSTGHTIVPGTNQQASALEFDGSSKVTERLDSRTTLQGNYYLSTSKGIVYVNVTFADGTKETFQVVLLNDQTLTLSSNDPYIYYNGTKLLPAIAVNTTVFKKQTPSDISGNNVKVIVKNDSVYSVKVYVTHQRGIPGDTATLVGSKTNTTGTYTLNVAAISGDLLKIDVLGSIPKTSINAYYQGIPIIGQIYAANNETVTTSGWSVGF